MIHSSGMISDKVQYQSTELFIPLLQVAQVNKVSHFWSHLDETSKWVYSIFAYLKYGGLLILRFFNQELLL